MRLYNQTRNALEWGMQWDGEHRSFAVEPFGTIEIDDDLVEHCKSRGLPLATTPMSPEQRAGTVLEEEKARAREDELTRLKEELASATFGIEEARKTVERIQHDLSQARADASAANDFRQEAEERARKANADRAAAESLLQETVQKLTAAEDRAMKAEAQVAIGERQSKTSRAGKAEKSGEQPKAS